jgi:hypothetical protein
MKKTNFFFIYDKYKNRGERKNKKYYTIRQTISVKKHEFFFPIKKKKKKKNSKGEK